MGNQKTIERDTETDSVGSITDTGAGSKTQEPPSWGEIADKTNTKKGTASMVGVGALTAAGTVLLGPSFPVILFAVTTVGGLAGLLDTKTGATAGVGVGVFAQLFLSGLSGFLASFLIGPLLVSAIIGLIVGGAGAFIGSKVKDKVTE
jgi:hypothetical protein